MGAMRIWIAYLLALASLLALPVAAQPQLLDDMPAIRLDHGQLSALRDKSGQLTLAEARIAFAQNHFKSINGNLSAGYVQDAYWLHLSLERLPKQPAQWWLEVLPPYLDDIQMFHIDPTGQIDHRQGGDFHPQSTKEESYRGTLFKLDLPAGQHEIFIRLKTTSTMTASLKLWQPNSLSVHLRISYFVFGLYFSLILTVLLFNAANWLISRRTIFIAYVVYLSLNALQWLGINGFVAEFIFPEQPLLANLTLSMALSLAVAMAFIFFSMLFELRKYHPWIYHLNQFGAVLGVATAIAAPLGHYQSLAPWLLLTAMVSLATAPWPLKRLWRTGFHWNRLLVLAYAGFATLVSINILSSLALISYSEPIVYAGMASNIFHILVLHLAILLHYRRVEHAANTDPLTGLVSRRHFTELADREINRARRTGEPIGLMMLDIDHFKTINDTHGHAMGDRALVAFAKALQSALRNIDIIARLGGDEFVVLLPAIKEKELIDLAERVMRALSKVRIDVDKRAPITLTGSIGLASSPGAEIPNLDELMQRADASLYKAKEKGRNTVVSDSR